MCANIMFVIGVLIFMLACFLAGFGLCAKLTNDAINGGRLNWLYNLFGWCPRCWQWFSDDVRARDGRGFKWCSACEAEDEADRAEQEAEWNRGRPWNC